MNSIKVPSDIPLYFMVCFQTLDLSNVTIDQVVNALDLESYFPTEYVIGVPLWFKVFMTILYAVCTIFSCIHNARTIFVIASNK